MSAALGTHATDVPGVIVVISHSGQYGIRALVYLAQVGTEANVTSAEVAAATGLPRNYLTKILNTLVQAGILESTRGPNGGFRFAILPVALSLSEAIAPFEEPHPSWCLLGPECCPRDADPCRTRCRAITAAVKRFLDSTSIADLARRPKTTLLETHSPGRIP